jgi:hypothetical protein
MSNTIYHIATSLLRNTCPLHMNTTIALLMVCAAGFNIILNLKQRNPLCSLYIQQSNGLVSCFRITFMPSITVGSKLDAPRFQPRYFLFYFKAIEICIFCVLYDRSNIHQYIDRINTGYLNYT